MLEQAALKKLGGNNLQPGSSTPQRVTPTAAAVSTPPPVAASRPTAAATSTATATKKSPVKNSNGLPFSDELYEHMKFVVTKLTGRMKAGQPLSQEEFARFQSSVQSILSDLNSDEVVALQDDAEDEEFVSLWQPDPIQRGYKELAEGGATETGKDAFQTFRGSKSTWQVPGV